MWAELKLFVRTNIYTILWKNLIIRKRHWLLTILEALVPIFLFSLFTYARATIVGFVKLDVTTATYEEKISQLNVYDQINLYDTKLYFAPTNQFTKDLVEKARKKLYLMSSSKYLNI